MMLLNNTGDKTGVVNFRASIDLAEFKLPADTLSQLLQEIHDAKLHSFSAIEGSKLILCDDITVRDAYRALSRILRNYQIKMNGQPHW
jgi:hypothetical protein